MASMDVHYTLSGGWWPTVGTHYRKPAELAARQAGAGSPSSSTTSPGELLHRRATDRLLKACCEATGCKPKELDRRGARLVQWGMPRLLTTFLDSPDFLTR